MPSNSSNLKYIGVLALFLAHLNAYAETTEFSIPTTDGLSKISGQIDRPECAKQTYPVVVMVGGTGLFTRNAFFGRSGTDRDLLFKDFSERLNRKCIATVRFDYRGVKCDVRAQSDIANCIDQVTRLQVTDETILDDIQVVYDFAKSQASLDSNNIVLFGHSEGTLNISRLVARGSVQPKGIMFLGGLTESAVGILRWQVVERPLELMMKMDANHDDILTNDEIKAAYPTSYIKNLYSLDSLLSASGSKTEAETQKGFEAIYETAKTEALKHADSDPYLMGALKFSTYKWWKRWFLDDVSVLENLKNFTGPIEYHNGDIDSQTPGIREQAILQASAVQMKSQPNFVLHAGKGHGLSNDPLYGPLEEPAADMIVDQISKWLR